MMIVIMMMIVILPNKINVHNSINAPVTILLSSSFWLISSFLIIQRLLLQRLHVMLLLLLTTIFNVSSSYTTARLFDSFLSLFSVMCKNNYIVIISTVTTISISTATKTTTILTKLNTNMQQYTNKTKYNNTLIPYILWDYYSRISRRSSCKISVTI